MRGSGSNGSIPGIPTSFEAAADIALNAEFNFKAARFGTHGYIPNSANYFSSFNRPEPMDLRLDETDEDVEFRAVEQHRNILRCFTCGSTKHLRPNYPFRRAARLLQAGLPPLTRSLVRCGKT